MTAPAEAALSQDPMRVLPCEEEPDAWFEHGSDDTELSRSDAKKLCWSSCPVRAACLELAMRAEGQRPRTFRHGLYGGLTPSERVALAASRRKETGKAVAAAVKAGGVS